VVGLLLVGPMLGVSSIASMIAVPFIALSVILGARRLGALLVTGVAVAVAIGGLPRDAIWHLERGWAVLLAGWFVALTLRWPAVGFFSRALASVLGAFTIMVVFFVTQPGSWAYVDWLVTERIMSGTDATVSALAGMARLFGDPEAQLSGRLVTGAYQAAEQQGSAFPALLGLSSLAALGVAWWGYVRIALGNDRGIGPLRDFRFNDHLVWLFIGGLVVLGLASGDGAERAGTNVVVFMGSLYALRGVAVLLFLSGGLSLIGFVLVVFGVLLLGPLLFLGPLVIGLGDTWLDLRSRGKALVGNNEGRGG
jgi:Ca2+/Na+ antiporter